MPTLRHAGFQPLRGVKTGALPSGGHAFSATGGAVPARPMNKNAQDVMVGAPSTVEQKQLDELHIALVGELEE
jgi:hypothetical protein